MQFAAEQARRFDLNSKGERSKHGLGSIITIGAKHTGEPEKLKLVSESRKILVIPEEGRNTGSWFVQTGLVYLVVGPIRLQWIISAAVVMRRQRPVEILWSD